MSIGIITIAVTGVVLFAMAGAGADRLAGIVGLLGMAAAVLAFISSALGLAYWTLPSAAAALTITAGLAVKIRKSDSVKPQG